MKQAVRQGERGFTAVELLTVVAVLGTLVAVAVPVYLSSIHTAQRRTCFMNQNTLARATELYLAVNHDFKRSDLAGVVNKSHPIVVHHIVRNPPRCPAGQEPLDPENPTLEEGAYRYDSDGELLPCTLGSLAPHGRFRN